jgi:hypothetical protein
MTTQNENPLHLNVGKGRAWKDLFVVTFLVVVLGAFVAQIASSPKHSPGSEPMTSAATVAPIHG